MARAGGTKKRVPSMAPALVPPAPSSELTQAEIELYLQLRPVSPLMRFVRELKIKRVGK